MAAAVVLVVAFFLYNNVYRTITQSQEVVILKREVAPDAIDIKKVDAIINNIKTKTQGSLSQNMVIKNLFYQPLPQPPTP